MKSFTTNEQLKDLLLKNIEEQECRIITHSIPKCTKKSRSTKELFMDVFSDDIICVSDRNVIIGANYRDLLEKHYGPRSEIEQGFELPWGEWVEGSNVLIFHKGQYYLRVYMVEKNEENFYIYNNGNEIEKDKKERLNEFLPTERENDKKVIVNNIKLSSIFRIEFDGSILERI